MADIILCWVFWIIGGQVDAEAGGGGGRQGQGQHQVPRVPANKMREKNWVKRRSKIIVSVAVLPKGGRLQASPTLHQGEVHTKTTHVTTRATRLCHELDYPYF